MPLINENINAKLIKNDPVQIGRTNVDPDLNFEEKITIPWASSSEASYLYYECVLGTMLDSGIVIHNRLPQVDREHDSISGCDYADLNADKITNIGVSLNCKDQYKDIVQRMGHARYWFRLWGQALRIGYQVPIPAIKSIGGVKAIPYDRNPQWGLNRILPGGNFSGTILWHAVWSLWYTTDSPTINSDIPAADFAARISNKAPIPEFMQAPYSQPDYNAKQADSQRVPNP